jgi:hypothetical protein
MILNKRSEDGLQAYHVVRSKMFFILSIEIYFQENLQNNLFMDKFNELKLRFFSLGICIYGFFLLNKDKQTIVPFYEKKALKMWYMALRFVYFEFQHYKLFLKSRNEFMQERRMITKFMME